jgi:hypothetical protein
MEQSPSRETNSSSAGQEVTRILWNPKVHQHVHNSPPLVPTLGQMNPAHAPLSYLLKTHFNIILPSTPRSYCQTYFIKPTKVYHCEVQTKFYAHELVQPPVQHVPGSFPGVMRPGREVEHSPPPSAVVRNMWSYASTPPMCLRRVERDKSNLCLELVLPLLSHHFNDVSVILKNTFFGLLDLPLFLTR